MSDSIPTWLAILLLTISVACIVLHAYLTHIGYLDMTLLFR